MTTNDEIIKEMRKKENDGETFYNVLDDALDKAREEEINKKKFQVKRIIHRLENLIQEEPYDLSGIKKEIYDVFPDCKEPEKKKE